MAVGDDHALIIDERQLALGRRIGARRDLHVRNAGHFQMDLGLAGVGADFRKAEAFAGDVERDHGGILRWVDEGWS
jgi:hypothetical protein